MSILSALKSLFALRQVVEIVRLSATAKLPEYATDGAAGLDLFADPTHGTPIEPGERKLIPTNIAISLPRGYEAQIRPRSGLALKKGITVLNSPGTIDSDYRGAIGIVLYNAGANPYIVMPGDRIAQMVITRYEQVSFQEADTLDESERGTGGFGSTGLNALSTGL